MLRSDFLDIRQLGGALTHVKLNCRAIVGKRDSSGSTTYTIGFSVNNPVLPAAAEVGGGKYYTAGDEISLGNALKNAVSNIKASTSNAGGVATLSEVTKAGNILYQPVFNPNGWYGELRCFMLDTTATNGIGSSCGKQKAEIPAAENRIIISNKVEKAADTAPPKTTIFSFAATTDTLSNMTEVQRAALGADQKSQLDTINFLRGGTVNGMRTRSNGLLGDIIDGQPTIIGEPSGLNSNPGYLAYQATNKNRKFVLIGANDGMLHAFNGSDSDMGEIMGYIPSAVYSHLQTLTAQNYGQSASAPHTYHVNGASRQMDLRVGNTDWRTYMVGGLGQGGKGFHALDVSDAKTLASTAAVKWEWTDVSDSDMGYSFSTPLIYNVRTSATGVTTAAIFANGYENKFSSGAPNTSALYIVNAVTGDLIKKITVPDSTGLSSPAGVDFGQDGILDYVYAGDLNGQLWRFDLTAESPTSFHVVSKPIFIAQNSAGVTQPITMRPSVKPVNHADESPAGNLILLGTGKLLTDADRADTSTQTIYGVLDEMDDAPLTLKRIDLLTQTITDTVAVSEAGYRTGTYRKVSNHSLDLTKKVKTQKGWLLDLPLSSERVVASPRLFDDKVLFATGNPKSEQKCLPSGKGWIMGLNPMTGSVTQSRTGKDYSFTDIMLDNKSTVADQVSFPSGASYASGFEKDGIPTELSYVAAASKIVSSSSKDSGYGESGHVIALREANSMGIYIGNAKSGTHTGIPMPMPGSTGVGDIYSGAIGDSKVNKDTLLGPSSSTRVSTSLWREIK